VIKYISSNLFLNFDATKNQFTLYEKKSANPKLNKLINFFEYEISSKMLRIFHLFPQKVIFKQPSISQLLSFKFCSSINTSHTNSSTPQQDPNIHSHYKSIFQKIGLEEKLINNTLPNAKLSSCLANLCQRLDVSNCNKRQGIFISISVVLLINIYSQAFLYIRSPASSAFFLKINRTF